MLRPWGIRVVWGGGFGFACFLCVFVVVVCGFACHNFLWGLWGLVCFWFRLSAGLLVGYASCHKLLTHCAVRLSGGICCAIFFAHPLYLKHVHR